VPGRGGNHHRPLRAAARRAVRRQDRAFGDDKAAREPSAEDPVKTGQYL